jgi:hypothetical protein
MRIAILSCLCVAAVLYLASLANTASHWTYIHSTEFEPARARFDAAAARDDIPGMRAAYEETIAAMTKGVDERGWFAPEETK